MAPSAAPYGNYAHYYTKRKVSLLVGDPRVTLLPRKWTEGARICDIGCNSGNVSVELGQQSGALHVHGVDIDDSLIRKAHTHLAYVHSLQGKSTNEPNHFPLSLVKTHGFLPIPPPPTPASAGSSSFPNNVTFSVEDFVISPLDTSTTGRYDLILAFSLSKWIHLHHLDTGLIQFFQKVYDALAEGGRFVLEKQAWGGYKDGAKKGGGNLKANLKLLTLRPTDFSRLLQSIGFVEDSPLIPPESAGSKNGGGGAEGFDRPMEVFRKPRRGEVEAAAASGTATAADGERDKVDEPPAKEKTKEKKKRSLEEKEGGKEKKRKKEKPTTGDAGR